MPRQRPGMFLSPTGVRRSPLRKLPKVHDEPETVDRIREATTIRDEPEVICDEAILTDWSEVALLHQSKQHADDVADAQIRRPEMDPEERVKDITRRAKHAKVDLSRETFTMNVEIQRARTGGRQVPGRVLRRLESLETLLDGLS